MNPSLPLLNVMNGSQAANASRSTNLADSFSADASFSHLLNSQVNARTADSNAQHAALESQDSSASAPPPTTPAPAAAQAAQSTQSTASGDKNASTSATSEKQETSAKDDDQDDDTTTQASAELLALVANLQQNAVTPVNNGKSQQGNDTDLLAQAKRGGGRGVTQDAQASALEAKGKKIDFAGLQSSIDADKAKLGAAQAGQDESQSGTDLGADGDRSGKPAIDLGSAAKAAPKSDATPLGASVQLAKVAPEAQTLRQDQPQATPTPVLMPAMQQALATNQPQAVFGAAYTDKIQPNVGSAGWDQAVGNKITWMATGGIQSASLTLNPPDLGPMQVVLSVHNQQADATFITAQPEVKQALEAAMPKLREMMDQAGIQLGQATVNTGMPNQQQNANDQQQARSSSSSGGAGREEEGELALAGVGGTAQTTTSTLGLVDTFV